MWTVFLSATRDMPAAQRFFRSTLSVVNEASEADHRLRARFLPACRPGKYAVRTWTSGASGARRQAKADAGFSMQTGERFWLFKLKYAFPVTEDRPAMEVESSVNTDASAIDGREKLCFKMKLQ